MEIFKFQAGQTIVRRNDQLKYCYLVQEGTVVQKFDFSEIRLGVNSIFGLPERAIFHCDYVAEEDVVLAGFFCRDPGELKKMIAGQERLRTIFLRTMIEQRHQLLTLYTALNNKVRQFHSLVETCYGDYTNFCNTYKVEMHPFTRMESFNPLEMQHKAEPWEVNHSVSIMRNYLREYLQLMEKDDSLTVGVIMEASAQMRRFTQGIYEMEAYLSYNKDILFGETRNDLFALLFDLSIQVYAKKYDIEPILKDINLIAKEAQKLELYDERILSRRYQEFQEFHYDGIFEENAENRIEGLVVRKEIDITREDCVAHILEYAGYNDREVLQIAALIEKFRDLPDQNSSDRDVHELRKKLTSAFYDTYTRVFLRAVQDESSLTAVLEMFLNFGFMDVSMAGEENARQLYNLSAHLDVCKSERIYTLYDWLKCVYRGEKEPSKNEFDMDYRTYLSDQVRTGSITKAEAAMYLEDRVRKVEYEIRNMFVCVNRQTYGKITTFCPILREQDFLNNVEKMLVTAERLETALNDIRRVDFSAFYREVVFSDVAKGINNERIMREVLPDIILMPNIGSRVIMWQETAGVKNDTPARFMFPIFTTQDIRDFMLVAIGAFRWEMCRKEQGMRWNDIREKSLTARYCAYIQFYRKNRDLSDDAKEKIKGMLTRAKNSYKEVFIRDYINWINYESKGSSRLNKVSREILAATCPFARPIRSQLKSNPQFQLLIGKSEAEMSKQLARHQAIYNKYVKAGGTGTEELAENLAFYQM